MAIKYDIYETPLPDKDSENTYHIRLINTGIIDTERLAEEIEFSTSLTAGDVKNVFTSLNHLFVEYLSRGYRVHIEGLGYFQLSLKAPAINDPKKMRAEHIRVKTIKFLPEKKMKAQLSKLKFERIKRKNHSQKHESEDIIELLKEYFRENIFITRSEFEKLCGLTRGTAINRINDLIKRGVLIRKGVANSSIYILAV